MADLKLLEDLSNAFGPSGFEEEVAAVIRSHCGGLDIRSDAMHNVYVEIPGRKMGKPVLMLDAHSDECGFMVQAIQENGLLSIIMLGGFHLTSLPAHAVIIRTEEGKRIRGIITSKPVHFLTEKQKADTSLDIEALYIDVGACSRLEVTQKLGISIGDPVMPDVSFQYRKEDGVCFGKAFDNRLGCHCIIETLRALEKCAGSLAVDVTGAFAAQEEVGMRGAVVTAQQVKPDLAIVFEGSPADDSFYPPGIAQGVMRGGVQIRRMDSSYITSPAFVSYAHKIGKKHGIAYQDAVRRGGSTNAGKISLTEKAVPVLVLGIPSRYVHSHYNFCAAEDIDAAVNMAVQVILGLEEESIARILGCV